MRRLFCSAWACSAITVTTLGAMAAEPTPAPASVAPAVPISATSQTILALRQPIAITKATEMPFGAFLEQLSKQTHIQFEVDTKFLAALGMQLQDLRMVQMPLDFDATTTVGDALQKTVRSLAATSADAQQSYMTFGVRVRGNTAILGPTFVPPTIPRSGARSSDELFIPSTDILAAYYGPSVALTATKKPIRAVLDDLRETSGCSIVVDPKIQEKLDLPVTLTLTDARLMTALQVVARLGDVSVALIDNVFYLTDEATADQLNHRWQQNVYGDEAATMPPLADKVSVFQTPPANSESAKAQKPKKGKKKAKQNPQPPVTPSVPKVSES